MKTNLFYDHRDIMQIFPDDTIANDMVDLLTHVIKYYMEGDQWHRRHFDPVDREEYQESLEFLKSLRDLVTNMSVEDERSLIVQNEFLKLNLNHWIAFMKKTTLDHIYNQLTVILAHMKQYLNQDNIMEYREATDVIERWVFGIMQMQSYGR